MTAAIYAAADWGTTSFRLWTLSAMGELLGETRGAKGMAALSRADYPAVLEQALAEAGAGADTPVIICGMAGAAQGWHEAAYITLPADLDAIPGQAVQVPGLSRDVRILPGLAQRPPGVPDVMRGEETLLLGLALNAAADGLICLPGTHSKWVRLEEGSVRRFSTAMTGEVYGLLANQSVLKHFVEGAGAEGLSDLPEFRGAVREALAAPEALLRALFTVRSGPLLLGAGEPEAVAARLSGLLIGAEIAGMKPAPGSEVTLVGSGPLAASYETALHVAGLRSERLDAEALAIAGLYHAARLIWPLAG